MKIPDFDALLKTPFRDRAKVEAELACCSRRMVLLLSGLLNAGLVRGDWRRVLVRNRIRQLTEY